MPPLVSSITRGKKRQADDTAVSRHSIFQPAAKRPQIHKLGGYRLKDPKKPRAFTGPKNKSKSSAVIASERRRVSLGASGDPTAANAVVPGSAPGGNDGLGAFTSTAFLNYSSSSSSSSSSSLSSSSAVQLKSSAQGFNGRTTTAPTSIVPFTSATSSNAASAPPSTLFPGNAPGASSSKYILKPANRHGSSTETAARLTQNDGSIVGSEGGEDADAEDHPRSRPADWKGLTKAVKPITYTPSGRPYRQDCGDGKSYVIPDGRRTNTNAKYNSTYRCPVRNCQMAYSVATHLGSHFEAMHPRSIFNDNCDGTLTVIGQGDEDDPHFKPCVVSQNPTSSRHEPAPAHPRLIDEELAKTAEPWSSRSVAPASTTLSSGSSKGTGATIHPPDMNTAKIAKAGGATPTLSLGRPQHPMEAAKGTTGVLQLAMATSDTWRTLNSIVRTLEGKKGWLTAYKGALDFERRAFAQLIELPPRNNISAEWLNGIKKSNQKSFKGLICVLIAIVGDRGPCQACKNRTPEKRRQCAALPAQAKDMAELQQLVGDKCADCFHFPTKTKCGFPSGIAPSVMKQTPIPIPRMGHSTAVQSTHPSPPLRPTSKTPVPLPALPSIPVVPLQAITQRQPPPDITEKADSAHTVDSTIAAKGRRSERISALSADDGRDANSALASKPFVATESITDQTSARSTLAQPMSANMMGKALSLLTEISKLPSEEQSGIYSKIVEMIEVIRRPTLNLGVDSIGQMTNPIAEEWETAPGRLACPTAGTGRESRVAFSTSYLRREVVDVQLATQISRGQRVLNRHIPALHQVLVQKFDARWDCSLTVLEGFVRVKTGQVEVKIGQGGIFIISQDMDCFITNVTCRDCPVQFRWVER